MRVRESTGKTVEDAIESALKELGDISREKVDIEVLTEGSRGLFGFLGTKAAVVRVTMKEDKAKKAQKFLRELMDKMQLQGQVEITGKDEAEIFLDIRGEELGNLIGRRGQTLDSIQYLLNLVLNKGEQERVRIIVDVSGYRRRREQTLYNLALRLAQRVGQRGESIALEPMSAQERRVIHLALQDNPHVYTQSRGEEPERKIIICPKK